MGRIFAEELSDDHPLDLALSIHLQYNHYPPVPLSMVPVCSAAIDAYNEGDYKRHISLPSEVFWRDNAYAPAYAIIEAHHLESFLEDENV
jgi:hypothetical protein